MVPENTACLLVRSLQENTVCEEIDLSDNYIEGDGAKALASVLKDNMFIVNLVSTSYMTSSFPQVFKTYLPQIVV